MTENKRWWHNKEEKLPNLSVVKIKDGEFAGRYGTVVDSFTNLAGQTSTYDVEFCDRDLVEKWSKVSKAEGAGIVIPFSANNLIVDWTPPEAKQ